jgi:acetyl esterase/lipase
MEMMFEHRPEPANQQPISMNEQRNWMRDAFIGKGGDPAILAEMSPIRRLEKGMPYPPLLLAHGTEDVIVLCKQSENMYQAYLEAGGDAELILVPGANHEGAFWSSALLDAVQEFITRKLHVS